MSVLAHLKLHRLRVQLPLESRVNKISRLCKWTLVTQLICRAKVNYEITAILTIVLFWYGFEFEHCAGNAMNRYLFVLEMKLNENHLFRFFLFTLDGELKLLHL